MKVNDIVRLKNGTSNIRVNDIYDGILSGVYVKSNIRISQPENKFVLIEEVEYKMKDKLFEVVDSKRYGKGLAVNSANEYVLEMKDTGNYESFPKEKLEVVMPYTYDVVFTGNGGKRYSYLGKAGEVETGDLLIESNEFNLVKVVGVNTKSESATKYFQGNKLVTVKLSAG